MSSPDATLCKPAVQDEYDSLITHQTWTLKQLPPNCFFFKIRPGARGAPPRYKARLVAKGYLLITLRRWLWRNVCTRRQTSPPKSSGVLRSHPWPRTVSPGHKNRFSIWRTKRKHLPTIIGRLRGSRAGTLSLSTTQMGVWASRVWNHHFNAFLKRFGLVPSNSNSVAAALKQYLKL